jgi:hypothetical protein
VPQPFSHHCANVPYRNFEELGDRDISINVETQCV